MNLAVHPPRIVNAPTNLGGAFAAAVNTQTAIRTPKISFTEVECCVVFRIFIVVLLFLEAMLVCWFLEGRIVPSLYQARTGGKLAQENQRFLESRPPDPSRFASHRMAS
jgi:hypothetical protein